jgi:Zn-dependent protease
MLNFKLLRIPVTVEWWFWLAAVLLGGGLGAKDPDDWMRVAVWTAVVLVSILVHEFGHALAGRRFGASPSIRLHGFGGVTFLPGARFSRRENLLVSAAGPAAGLALGLMVLGIHRGLSGAPALVELAVTYGLYVNFVWTFINLLPIQPLDGGQILASLLGPSRARLSSGIGFILAVGLCLWTLQRGMLFSAFMLAMLAYYNFRREPVEGGVVTQ